MKCDVRGAKCEGRLFEDGFEILPGVLSEARCRELLDELSILLDRRQAAASRRIGGLRDLLRASPLVKEIAQSNQLARILQDRVPQPARPVRALFFDKTPAANWAVPWHQDLAITVAERIDTPGFTGWS